MNKVTVIGAGLAGCEAAWQAAKAGAFVELHEMKPHKFTPAHTSPLFAELVCSNSLRSNETSNASGLLKQELRHFGSLIIEAADASAVPAGSALAVDREKFSTYITEKIKSHPNIRVVSGEVTRLDGSGVQVVATGPLTSDALSRFIAGSIGAKLLHFYDAAAPIIDAASIDMGRVFAASRYGKGDPCYLNCPMTAEEYGAFHTALVSAKEAPLREFERELSGAAESAGSEGGKNNEPAVFEGCMPVEVMARRGYDTIRYGPMKPVGICDPATGCEPFAVVQLRREDAQGTMYNIVGFQTRLTFPEQRRVFGMIPGLAEAEFLRYGVMHRNTFIDSPRLLCAGYSLRDNPDLFFAGQITGVEGYVESTSSGLVAGINAARRTAGLEEVIFPEVTETGALAAYISRGMGSDFQPMNANFGILAPLGQKVKGGKAARHRALAARAEAAADEFARMLSGAEVPENKADEAGAEANTEAADNNIKESGR